MSPGTRKDLIHAAILCMLQDDLEESVKSHSSFVSFLMSESVNPVQKGLNDSTKRE